MKCDKCEKQANVHLTDIENGKVVESHLCHECAQSSGQPKLKAISAADFLAALAKHVAGQANAGAEKACGGCGATFRDFATEGRLGCPGCYEAFEDRLAPLLEGIHTRSEHVGKRPSTVNASAKEQTLVLHLREQLGQAVAEENYEQAAALRDRLRELTGD